MTPVHLLAARKLQDLYPKYSIELLEVFHRDYLGETVEYLARTGREHFQLATSFDIKTPELVGDEDLQGKSVVAMSLFFKPASFRHRHVLPAKDAEGNITLAEIERRNHPLWEGTQRHERNFLENYVYPVLKSDFHDWLPVVYLARDLSLLKPMLQENGFHVVQMKHDSIAHNPGAMWRFLSFNLAAEFVYIQDTDRPFHLARTERFRKLMLSYPKAALAQSLQSSSPGGTMALILGNDLMVRPPNIDFDAARMMLGFIILNILHEDRANNFCHEPSHLRDDTKILPLSKRFQREHFGPTPSERVARKCYPYYGFDEQWLAEFVFYHLASQSKLATLVQNRNFEDVAQRLALAFQRSTGNVVVAPDEITSAQQTEPIRLRGRGGRLSVGKRSNIEQKASSDISTRSS